MFKIIKWIVLAVVLLLILGALIVYFSINGIIKSTVQTQATNSLNLQTTLGGADLSLFGGKLSLSDLQIANPGGFSASKMFTLNGVDVGVKYGQLRDDPIHVAEIKITNPQLVIEQAGGKINVKAAMDNMPKSEPAPSSTGKREKDQPIKLIIDDLTVSNTSVTIKPGNLPGLGSVKDYTLTIPTVDLKNIGTGEGNQNGAAIKDVVKLVLKELTAKAADSPQLPPEVRQLLHMNVGEMVNEVKERVGTEVNQAVKNATSNPSQLLQGLEGLGGKKKK